MKARSIGFGLVGTAVLVGGGIAGYQAYVERQIEHTVAEIARDLPPNVKLEYGEVDTGFLGTEFWVKDVKVLIEGGTPISTHVHVLSFDRRNNPPNHFHAKAVEIRQSLSGKDDEQAAMLRKLGYEEIRGSYEVRYRYDPQNKQLDMQELRGELEGMGAMTLRMKLDNFDLQKADAQAANQLPEFEIREFALSYRDDSLVRRAIKQAATDRGISEADYVAEVQQQIDAQTASLEDPFFVKLGEELKAFVREPGTLTLSAAPPKAIPVMEVVTSAMIRAADLPKQLNMTVESSR